MRHVPAFGLTPRLAEALRGSIVGVHLDGEFFRGKKKLHQQWKPQRIARGRAHQLSAELLAQICQRSFPKWTVRNHAIVAREPGLSDAFVEFVIGIDRGKIKRAPRARVESG